MRNIRNVPFFGRSGFFRSPPKPFELPIYAEAVARDFVSADPKPIFRARSVHPHVLDFIDDCALDSDSDI